MRLRNVKGARDVLAANDYVIDDPAANRGKWNTVFGNDNPIYMEIGMGKGQFLLAHAEKHPEINYIGVEMYASVLIRAVQKAEGVSLEEGVQAAMVSAETVQAESVRAESVQEETVQEETVQEEPGQKESVQRARMQKEAMPEKGRRYPNVRFLNVQAENLETMFAPGEVDQIYLNFSDPWPKVRHAKRRLTSPTFLARYEKILKKDGILEFKTDNQDLFTFSLESVPAAGWELLVSTRDLHHDPVLSEGNIMTEYEKKFSEKGQNICKLIARQKA